MKDLITPVNFASNFKNDYYEYGMDVIEDRAIPDVRDGLKPVQRAILIEMLNSHITSKSKTVKVAKIVGAVIGKWHPHGDTAVEDALAIMSAPWKNAMPAITIKGNGGSVFGDSHAAGRYIEAKLSPTGDAYGRNLKKGIVPYVPNFDETAQMPKVLPAQLPYLLINGGEGIAVGLASSIPTHNPAEVVKAFIRYTKNSNLTVKQLMTTLKGPDFPTKGQIINQKDLADIYETGHGYLRIRGRIRYDKKDRSLHVYEIPYNFSGSMNNLVDELVSACLGNLNAKGKKAEPKIQGVLSVADHSGKDGIDITIKLRKSADPDLIMQNLFAKTRLETTYKVDMTALNNRHEKRYSLKSYFKEYLAFQNYIINNEYKLQERTYSKRLEIISGLLKLRNIIDNVIKEAKNSTSKSNLEQTLINKFDFTDAQAEYIANLPIYRLNKVDYKKLEQEKNDLTEKLSYAKKVQNESDLRRNIIIKRHEDELKNIKNIKRKTELLDEKPTLASKIEIPESKMYFSYNKYHYLRLSERKFKNAIQTTNKRRISFFDENGICYNVFLDKMKPTSDTGVLVDTIVKSEAPIVGFTNNVDLNNDAMILYVFATGNVKLTPANKLMTKQHSSKIKSAKTSQTIAKVIDWPTCAESVTINGQTFSKDKLSVQGPSGKGRKEIAPIKDGILEIKFNNEEETIPLF